MAIPLRADFDAVAVRSWAKRSKDGPQARRLLALAAIYEGASRTEAAKIGGVTLQIVRDWVVKFNADGPAGLIDRKAPGQPARLNDAHRAALAAIIESGPIPAVHGVVRWRIVDLCQWIFEEFRVIVSRQTLSRELRAMGYRFLGCRVRRSLLRIWSRAIGPAAPPIPLLVNRNALQTPRAASRQFRIALFDHGHSLAGHLSEGLNSLFKASVSAVKPPCFRAFLLPRGAPPLAPCIRQTLLPRTAGARHC